MKPYEYKVVIDLKDGVRLVLDILDEKELINFFDSFNNEYVYVQHGSLFIIKLNIIKFECFYAEDYLA